jgi:DNA modification methylase
MNETLKLRVSPMALTKLVPHPRNPRLHPEPGTPAWDALRVSLEHDYFDPIIVNDGTTEPTLRNVLVSGHLRVKVLMECGVKTADCVLVDYNEPTHLARMIAANRQTGEWQDDALAEILKHCEAPELAGFTDEQVKDLMRNSTPKTDAHAEPALDSAEELREKWGVETGQLCRRGEHMLLCGDALNGASWKKLGGPFGFCFADPPYDMAVWVPQLTFATSDALLMMGSDASLKRQTNEHFRGFFVYTFDSADSVMWTTTAMRQHTLIGMWRFKTGELSFKGLSTHYHHAGQNQDSTTGHEQSKPSELVSRFLPYFTREGECFADPFSGSGSAIISAERLNRKSRSVEISAANCAIIIDRYHAATGKTPRLT